jgi:ketosteroid isomerase-like protein
MRALPACCRLFALVVLLGGRALADDLDDVRAADAQRLAATISGDTGRLERLLSDDLRYAHSDGRVQTKRQFIAAVASSRIKYLAITPESVEWQPVNPGAWCESGRARLVALADGRRAEFTLRFLAVWRQETGGWRLLSYQSSQLAPAK